MVLLLTFFLIFLAPSAFSDDLPKLLIDVIKKHKLNRAIVIKDDLNYENIYNNLACRSRLVAAISRDNLLQYINNGTQFPYLETVIGNALTIRDVFQNMYFKKGKFVWLAIANTLKNPLKEAIIPLNCITIIIYKYVNFYKLEEFYTLRNRPFSIDYGTWSVKTGLKVTKESIFQRRKNCMGYRFRVFKLEENRTKNLENAPDEILQSITTFMNVSFEKYDLATFNSQPVENINIDAFDSIQAFHSSSYSTDILAPIWEFPMYLYVKYETDQLSGIAALARPFGTDVWIAIAVWLSISFVVLVVIDFLTEKYILNSKSKTCVCIYACAPLETICNQYGSNLKDTLAMRLYHIINRFGTLFIVPSYSAAIISFLTYQQATFPFKDITGLMESHYQLGGANNTIALTYFEKRTDEEARRLARNFFLPPHEMPINHYEGLKRICEDPNYSFLGPGNIIEQQTYFCRITQIPTPVFTTYAGIILERGSQFYQFLHLGLITLYTSGIIHRMNIKGTHSNELEDDGDNTITVSLQHSKFIFFILIGGALTAVMVLFGELLYNKQLETHKKNRQKTQ